MASFNSFLVNALIALAAMAVAGAAVIAGIEFWIYCTVVRYHAKRQ